MAPIDRDYRPILPLLEKAVVDSRRWRVDAPGDMPGGTIAFLNAHGVNQARDNAAFAQFLMSADYLLRDGIGVKLALRWLKMPDTENLNGTDLIPKIITRHKTCGIAIFGTSDAALSACAARLRSEGFDRIAPLLNGFLPDESYMTALSDSRPDIVILCLGMPRQELLAATIRKSGFPGMIICGGGWADFYSGTKPRAPEWIRAMSLEWLYRLLNEPRRLGKRYTIDLFSFFMTVQRAAKRQAP